MSISKDHQLLVTVRSEEAESEDGYVETGVLPGVRRQLL